MMFFHLQLSDIILCKELKFIVELEFLFFFLENKLEFTFQFVSARNVVKVYFGGRFKRKLFKYVCPKCCQGKLCAKWSRFSRQKSSYIRVKFFLTLFFIYLIEN